MIALVHALRAEWLKTRRTFLRMSPVFIAFITILIPLFIFLGSGMQANSRGSAPRAVAMEFTSTILYAWVIVLQPLYILLVTILCVQDEHAQGMWKHLNALPVGRGTQVIAKHLVGAVHLLAANLSLMVHILLCLLLIHARRPAFRIHLGDPVLWWFMGRSMLLCVGAGLTVLVPMLLMMTRLPGLGAPIIVWTLGFLLGCYLDPTYSWTALFPWSIGKVWMYAQIMPGASWHAWWVLPAITWVFFGLVLHIRLQHRKPMF